MDVLRGGRASAVKSAAPQYGDCRPTSGRPTKSAFIRLRAKLQLAPADRALVPCDPAALKSRTRQAAEWRSLRPLRAAARVR